MTDINANLEIDETTIAAAAQQCLESFETCLAQASAIHPREFSRVEDQAARFSDWTSGNGVFAPRRASMDHRLRYALEVQSVALGLLDSLYYRIRQCSDVIDGHGKNPESDVSDLTKALEQSCSDIALEIRYLNKLSNMIRRSTGKEKQALKLKNFQATNEDKDIERTLLNIFKLHIRDKFPRASEIIQQRLAEAMIFRRKRVLYWRYRQEAAAKLPKTNYIMPQPPVSSAQVDPLQEDKQKSRAAEPVVAPSEIQSATTLQPDIFENVAASPSVGSAMTIALSDHEALSFPAAPRANVKQKYDQLKKERLAAHQIVLDKLDKDSMVDSRFDRQNPRAIAEKDLEVTLEADLQALGEITCPYCLEALPAIEVFDQRKWRKHVKNDLDPYVCLFEECNEADELYKHSENWLRHMHKHNQIWPCRTHRKLDPFLTREDYIQHLREAHSFKMDEKKLIFLANRSARKARKLFASCPLCGKSEVEVGGHLESHIAGHLRSLALKSLPPYEDDMETDVGSDRDGCSGSQLSGVRTTDDPSIDGNSSKDGVDDELSRLSETEEMDFVYDAPHELDSGHADAWNALMGDWISNKPTLQQLLQISDKDPIFHLAQEKAKESHSFRQTSQQQQQQEPNQSVPHEGIPFSPLHSADHKPPCNTLFVGNLPIDADEEELKTMFAKQRGYKRLAFRTKGKRPLCFVEFEYISSATRALNELYGSELHNSTKGGIRLSFSKNPLGVRSSQPSWGTYQPDDPPTSQAASYRKSFLRVPEQQASEQWVWREPLPLSSSDGTDPYAQYGGYQNYIALWYQSLIYQQQQQEGQGTPPSGGPPATPLTTTERHQVGRDFGTLDNRALNSDDYSTNEEINTDLNSLRDMDRMEPENSRLRPSQSLENLFNDPFDWQAYSGDANPSSPPPHRHHHDLENGIATDSTNICSAPSSVTDPSSEVDDNGRRQDGYRWCCGRWIKINDGSLWKHLRTHDPQFPCIADPESCVRRFSTFKELKRHYLAQHKRWADEHDIPDMGRYLCEACGKAFTRPDNKARHIHASPACLGKIERMKDEGPRTTVTG